MVSSFEDSPMKIEGYNSQRVELMNYIGAVTEIDRSVHNTDEENQEIIQELEEAHESRS